MWQKLQNKRLDMFACQIVSCFLVEKAWWGSGEEGRWICGVGCIPADNTLYSGLSGNVPGPGDLAADRYCITRR